MYKVPRFAITISVFGARIDRDLRMPGHGKTDEGASPTQLKIDSVSGASVNHSVHRSGAEQAGEQIYAFYYVVACPPAEAFLLYPDPVTVTTPVVATPGMLVEATESVSVASAFVAVPVPKQGINSYTSGTNGHRTRS